MATLTRFNTRNARLQAEGTGELVIGATAKGGTAHPPHAFDVSLTDADGILWAIEMDRAEAERLTSALRDWLDNGFSRTVPPPHA